MTDHTIYTQYHYRLHKLCEALNVRSSDTKGMRDYIGAWLFYVEEEIKTIKSMIDTNEK